MMKNIEPSPVGRYTFEICLSDDGEQDQDVAKDTDDGDHVHEN